MSMFSRSDLTADELKFFGLQVDPFNEVYDDVEPWENSELSMLRHHFTRVMQYHQIGILIGESGSGKSTLIRQAAERVTANGDKARVVRLNVVDPARVTAVVLEECLLLPLMGKTHPNTTVRGEWLRNTLVERMQSSRQTVLIIDDAHRLKPNIFLHFRTLREFDTSYRLLSVVLVGEPPLHQILQQPEVSNVFGRARVHLMPPVTSVKEKHQGKVVERKPDRTGAYLEHLFTRVGQKEAFLQIWSNPQAVELVGELGRTPLNIGNVAVRAMRMSRMVASRVVSVDAVKMVGGL